MYILGERRKKLTLNVKFFSSVFQERLCAVRCSPDCHVGPWESWSPCRCDARDICGENCPSDGSATTSTRIRRVVSPPDGAGSSSCPPRVQKRQCPVLACRSSWTESPTDYPVVLPLSEAREEEEEEAVLYVGPWSDCLPLGGEPSLFRTPSENADDRPVQKRWDEPPPAVYRVQKRSEPPSSWPESQNRMEQWATKPAKTIFPPPKVGALHRSLSLSISISRYTHETYFTWIDCMRQGKERKKH
jgi:hypothetical protein